LIKKWRVGRWRLTITIAPMADVIGVNSGLEDDNHILMWDFDDTDLDAVVTALLKVQRIYELPAIHILETKNNKNFMAYCFQRTPWRKGLAVYEDDGANRVSGFGRLPRIVVEILAFTDGLDENYFKYGVYRRRFTLRVTPKSGREPKLIWTLVSDIPADCEIADLMRWTQYETLADDARRY